MSARGKKTVCPVCRQRVEPERHGRTRTCPACGCESKASAWLHATDSEKADAKERERERKAAYRLEHLEDERARARRYRAAHKDRINAGRRERYAHDEEYRERVKARNRGGA